MAALRALWAGELALRDAFWTWVVAVGLVVNVATTILFLVLIARDLPWAALAVGYGLSVPYNVVATVGVWRSAARHSGPPVHAALACAATLLLMTLLSVT